MTETDSFLVVLMMTIFSKKEYKKYPWRVEGISARKYQYYRKKCGCSDSLIRNTITQRSFRSLLWKERKYIDGWIHSVTRISKCHWVPLSFTACNWFLTNSVSREANPRVKKKKSLDLNQFLFEEAGQHLRNQILSQGSIYCILLRDRDVSLHSFE